MTDQVIVLPELNAIDRRAKRLPAECTRWLLDLASYPSTPEQITALLVADDDFCLVMLPARSWRILERALHVNRQIERDKSSERTEIPA